MAGDWGGWLAVQSTLLFWQKWLVDSFAHSAPEAWLSVLQRFYATADPLASAVAVSLLMASLTFLLSLPTNNHSFVDKIWSLIPVYYAWHFALHDKLVHTGFSVNPRLAIMAALITAWGARLTFNFARKGGYRWSAEDYRWPYIRQKVNAFVFLLFNFSFIALYQNLLLLSIVAPAYVAWQNVGTPLNAIDAAATALCAFFIIYETVADQQQWRFQSKKHDKMAKRQRLTAEETRGFLTSGLFGLSRHPNFWAEQSLWCSMYLFGVAASGRHLNWTIAAPIQLILLFQGSTWLTEKMSAAKYPAYKEYQQTTSCFFPWFPAKLTAAPKAPQSKSAKGKSPGKAKTPKRGRKKEVPDTPTVSTEDVGALAGLVAQAQQQEVAAPTRRSSRARQATKAAAAAAEQAAAEQMVAMATEPLAPAAAPAAASRPARSPRKSAKALAALEHEEVEEQPAATRGRQSSRLRTRSA